MAAYLTGFAMLLLLLLRDPSSGAASGGSGAAPRHLVPDGPRPSSALPAVPQAGAQRHGGTPGPRQSPPESLNAAGALPASRVASTRSGARDGADELSSPPRGPVRLPLPLRGSRRRAALLGLPRGLRGRAGGGPPSAPQPRWEPPAGRAGAEERGAGSGPCGPLRSRAPGLRDALLRAAARSLGALRTDSGGGCAGERRPRPRSRCPVPAPRCRLTAALSRRDAAAAAPLVSRAAAWPRCSHRTVRGPPRPAPSLIRSLPSRGFHHNLSWDARGLGFAAGVLPAPPPLPGCLQPVRRSAAAVPQQPSLLPPVLEAVCNDSVPGLPGVSNFTVYLYCNLFNSSRGSSRSGDLGATCSNAAWYLSAGEGGSAWARACWERYPAQFNSTVCSNTSLRETPGPQQVLLEQLCADPARGLAGARPPSRSTCPLGAYWEDAWSCFLGSRMLWGAWLCGSRTRELLPADLWDWLSQLCGSPWPQAQMPSTSEPGGTGPCSFGGWSLWTQGNAGLLELCKTASPSCFEELVCTNTSLLQLLGHPQSVVGVRCQGILPGGRCLLQQLLALLPLPSRLDTAELCPDPAAYLLGLAFQLLQCQEEGPGWAPHVNYLLRLLDRSLALSGQEEAGKAAGEELSEAILLSSLLDNASFWGLLSMNASAGILRAVGQYLGWERRASAKRELLSCFSAVLWDLLQDNDGAPALEMLVQEYLQMPEESFQELLLAAGPEAVQRFLALLHRSWHRLHGEVLSPVSGEEAMLSLAMLLLRRLPHLTPQLFVSLSQFIPFMAVSDIARLPPALLANESVLTALRTHSARLTQGQKAAFARRLLQAPFLGAVPTWPLSFLHAVLPLLPHLPLRCFLQLTPQQIWGLGDGWQTLRLGLVQGRHVAGSLANRSRAAGPELGRRLGALACFLSPEELQDLAWLQDPRGAVEQSLLACAAAGTLRQHGRVMLALAGLLRSTSLAMVSPGELPAWRGILPEMGVGFLERLSAAQLKALLPKLRPTQLTRAQVTVGEAARLCPLLPGLGPTLLAAILALLRAQGCTCLDPALPLLSAAQTASLLQGLQPLDSWPHCLLPLLPLQLLRPGAQALRGAPWDPNLPWSPQQVRGWAQGCGGSALGSLVVGMSCAVLQELGQEDFLGALQTLYVQPRSLPASLRRCVQEEVLRRPALSEEELAWLGPRFLMELPAKMVEMLPDTVMRLVLDYVTRQPCSLLALPATRRAALARGALRSLWPPAGTELAGEDLDRLGPLLGFLGRETVARIRPESLLPRLGDLQDTCLATEVATELGRLLLSEQALGSPPGWRLPTLQQLGRLVFLLPLESLRAIPWDLLSRDTVEQLLQRQQDWEQSELGRLCHPSSTPGEGPSQQEVLVAPLVAAAKPGDQAPVPSCADMRATFPAAWSAAQLAAMAPQQLEDCLGLLSRDPALRPDQLRAALGQARRLWGSTRVLEPAQTLRLGRLATQLGESELQELLLPDWGALSALGELDGWSPEQMRAVVSAFLRQRGVSARDLGLPELVALGHLLCGLPVAELRGLDSWELSKAAPFLGSLSLRCTEQQAEVLATHLTSRAAFGPAATWGPEIFAEVGTLAAGLPDIVLSALVPEQIWALTPRAIAAVPAPKFAVVFGPAQLCTLSSAQAAAVTTGQRRWLSSAQQQALASAQREGEAAQDNRGENSRVASVPMQRPACLLWVAPLPAHPSPLLRTSRLSMGTPGCWEGSGCVGLAPGACSAAPQGGWPHCLPTSCSLSGCVPSHLRPDETSLLPPPALNPGPEQLLCAAPAQS
ncbi:stereocilin [Phalacrocorax carbo]|uniref:stereocilin n=1 Tax=Phalacrocorax carbo TaxID=9209 RepID=UPI00311A15C3